MAETDEEKEISYAEILASTALNSEIIITVYHEEVERTKTGLKNLKAKQIAKIKEEGILPPQETLEFSESPSKEYEGYIDLRIMLKQKAIVKIKGMKIPDNEF